ncbi:long-chain-fatty-acid--CoA ligase [Solibacillus sp. FSL K6-1523]|uniref:long-chain-fatty-acid--CoA ligase n=1 Tax=Solibacillus sp. FSL K6-1523 TaxID=2921471 RepID=UPI0030F6FD99
MNKPWHKFYSKGLSKEIDVPLVGLFTLLEESAFNYPEAIAVLDAEREFTYEQLKLAVDKFSSALYKQGFRKGDRMAIMLPNSVEYIISYFSILRLGGIICQVNPMYQPMELEYILKDSGATWFISEKSQQQKLDEIGDVKDRLFIISADEKSVDDNNLYQWLKEDYEIIPPIIINPTEDIALLQYTGGTTGRSKGVMLTHANLLVNVHQSNAFQKDIMDIPGERSFGSSPLFHIAGIVGLNAAILNGYTYIAIRRFRVDQALEAIRKYRPTIFPGVPTIFLALVRHPNLKKEDLSSLKVCACGTAPLSLETFRELQSKTDAQIYESFGMSETLITHRSPLDIEIKEGSVGIPLPSTDAKIVDLATGLTEVPFGEPGELIIKGPQVMKGYWKNEEETNNALRDGWMYTGDIATMDEEGYFFIVGRKKDMIIAGGYNIYPTEIEEVLYKHPAISEVCVYGVPDAYRGETVKAAIVLRDGQEATEADIINWCNTYLARYKVPRLIEFKIELPKTAVGKILRRQLIKEEKTEV